MSVASSVCEVQVVLIAVVCVCVCARARTSTQALELARASPHMYSYVFRSSESLCSLVIDKTLALPLSFTHSPPLSLSFLKVSWAVEWGPK